MPKKRCWRWNARSSRSCDRSPPSHAARIRLTAAAVAELDVTCALAQVAAENRYVRPAFSDSGEIRIAAGRHPVIEKLTEKEATRFIPNDLYFDTESQFIAVITGPNMGGKSTYLRQAATIVILAQMGSFVPADSAVLSLVDRVFTRIGAADNLARGRSTFMVEMTETAVILNTATSRSLVVLDEIGRGTATYDGLVAGVGGDRAYSPAHPRAHAVRDALSRTDRAGGPVARRPRICMCR